MKILAVFPILGGEGTPKPRIEHLTKAQELAYEHQWGMIFLTLCILGMVACIVFFFTHKVPEGPVPSRGEIMRFLRENERRG